MRKNVLMVLILLLLAFSSLSFGQTDSKQPFFIIQIHLRQNTIKVGTPIVLDIQVINNTNIPKSVSVSPGVRSAARYYVATVLDDKNTLIPETLYGERMHGHGDDPRAIDNGSQFQTPIEPGGHLDQEYPLGRLYRITDPGTYSIRLSRTDLMGGGDEVKSNVVFLTVTQ